MTEDIKKDLLKNKSYQLFATLQEFNRNAGWAGYFFDGPDAQQLAATGLYEKTPKHGLHITTWHRNHNSLSVVDFIDMVTATDKLDVRVLGYADDGKNQAILVDKPQLFKTPAQSHITISWTPQGNAAASGYMQFGPIPSGISLPEVMHGGQMKFIMQNNREMDLTAFQHVIKVLEIQRLTEIAQKLNPEVRAAIEYENLPWDELKRRFISTGVEFNENMAKLYTQYRADTTDDKMSASEIEEQGEAPATADAASDVYDNAERFA